MLKSGAAVKIPSPIKFVAGLTWHDNKLYISGAVLADGRPSWRLISWSGWNGTTFTVRRTLFVAGKKCRGFTKPFRSFGPHTDLMGIAVQAGTLYLTSFAGPKGKGPGARCSPSTWTAPYSSGS